VGNGEHINMAHVLDSLSIVGFKSILALEDFRLTNLKVLIGGNGTGKSNFIDFFRMLRAMIELPLPRLASASLRSYIAMWLLDTNYDDRGIQSSRVISL